MGWCSGSDIYLAAADFEPLLKKAVEEDVFSASRAIEVFKEFAQELQMHDWDCESDALYDLAEGSFARQGLEIAMGKNFSCKGTCFEAHGPDDHEWCGCPCHTEE